MKKLFSLLLCLLLFSGCSQPAAEVSSSPTANTTPTSTIEATTSPQSSLSADTPIVYYKDLSDLFTFRFDSAYPEEIKTPEDFSSQEELCEHIYQECERRHSQLVNEIQKGTINALYLHITLDVSEWIRSFVVTNDYTVTVDCVLTDAELLSEWKNFVLNAKMKRNPGYLYDETIPQTGIVDEIQYCILPNIDISPSNLIATEIFKNGFYYYYPDQSLAKHFVLYPDWDEKTRNQYAEFENKIYQLAADKFKAAYEQAANYPFLN